MIRSSADARHHWRPGGQLHRPKRGCAVDPRFAPCHSPNELQLAIVCAARVQDSGGYRHPRIPQTDSPAESVYSLRPEALSSGATPRVRFRRTIRDTHAHASWLAWCRERVRRYPVVQDRQRRPGAFEPVLLRRATVSQTRRQRCHHLRQCELLHRPFQTMRLQKRPTSYLQLRFRFHGLRPAGRHRSGFRPSRKRVICIAGDGSIQMNIQELQTIVHHHLPLKIFVLNNSGYLSMRVTQSGFFRASDRRKRFERCLAP